jgi:hypothetical protein
MAAVFQEAAAAHRRNGSLDLLRFAATELFGVIGGAARDRISAFGAARFGAEPPFPSDLGGAETYIEYASRCVIRAISTHDFAKARYYDRQERRARALLAELRAQPE